VRRSHILALASFSIVALAFAYGIGKLLLASYGMGDAFPEYSSYRTDPMGAKAFYESLLTVPGLAVDRNVEPLKRMGPSAPTTFCILGVDPWDLIEFTPDEFSAMESILGNGGRLVITCSPEMAEAYRTGMDSLEEAQKKADERQRKAKAGKEEPKPAPGTPPEPSPGDPPKPVESQDPNDREKHDADKKSERDDPDDKEGTDKRTSFLPKMVVLPKAWGFTMATVPFPKDSDDHIKPVQAVRGSDDLVPQSVTWRSALVFKALDPAWRVVYRRGTDAVVMERRFGAGTVVMCGDSYFLSNQALREERHSDLLVWLVGANSRVIFDETHNGVVDEPGVAKLARKYRLQGVAAAFLILAALYIWRSASSLVPPVPERDANESTRAALGKDAASAFINLLRRSIPSRDVIAVCVREWEKSFAHARPDLRTRVDWMRNVAEEQRNLPAQKRDPLGTYRNISHELGKEWKR
jgi:hypothetical protein